MNLLCWILSVCLLAAGNAQDEEYSAPPSDESSSSNQNIADICITDISAKKCPVYGKLRNAATIEIDSNQIKAFEVRDDGSQEEAKSIKLPGTYLIQFSNIKVKEDMDFVVGDISVKLASFIEVQAVPSAGVSCGEKATLICDHKATAWAGFGVAENYGMCMPGHVSSCRYCDVCETTKAAEDQLTSKGMAPNVGNGEEQFSGECTTFKKGQTYTLTRTIKLPGTDQIDLGWLQSNKPDKDQEVAQTFQHKTGRLIVSMYLLNKRQPANCKQQSMCNNAMMSKLFGGMCQGCDTTSSCQEASGDPSKQFSLAACYDVEFNFDYREGQHGTC